MDSEDESRNDILFFFFLTLLFILYISRMIIIQ